MPNWLVKGEVLENYLQACLEANVEDFKNDWRLTPIFEHTKRYLALNYLSSVRKHNPHLLTRKYTNDTIGKPILQNLGGWYGSNSTAQYIGVLSNLMNHFGDLSGLTICEIGGGYGGQALTILDNFSPKCYDIIDLPEVTELQKKVLQGTLCKSGSSIPKKSYDLVISNYALSEVPDQDKYMKLLKRCEHGYITCNTEFVKLDFEHQRYQDIEGERETNYILIW